MNSTDFDYFKSFSFSMEESCYYDIESNQPFGKGIYGQRDFASHRSGNVIGKIFKC
jgi:hypothetical protein